jgi:hypothetical protein
MCCNSVSQQEIAMSRKIDQMIAQSTAKEAP